MYDSAFINIFPEFYERKHEQKLRGNETQLLLDTSQKQGGERTQKRTLHDSLIISTFPELFEGTIKVRKKENEKRKRSNTRLFEYLTKGDQTRKQRLARQHKQTRTRVTEGKK